jgi:DNA-binding NtrC family response regulator
MSHVLVVSENSGGLPDLFSDLSTADWEYSHWDALAMEKPRHAPADLLLLVGLPEPLRALQWLRQMRDRSIPSRMVAVLPRDLAPADLALAATVADDFILWPEQAEVVRLRLRHFLVPPAEVQSAYENLMVGLAKANLVGREPAFLRMADKIMLSAGSGFPALITGETGTGKDLFARAIHFLSCRRNQPFVPVDCGGIPDHLFENELFGHVRGAYTDAHGEQRGLAALADKGTLFLDEIDSLSLAAQAKLLRFLEDHQFKPLGSERYAHSDVKIVAASNRNLELQVAEKQFRGDLYFRLNVLHLELPPLRERTQDVPLLAQHFLALYTPSGTRKVLTPAALHHLMSYNWPGNIRELANVIQRAIVFSRGTQINGCDIALPEPAPRFQPGTFRTARQEAIQSFEREYVGQLLRRNQGNITWAANEAGKERRAFGRLVKKYAAAQLPRAAGQS